MAEERGPDRQAGRAAARARIEQQQTWVDLQVRQAMERGDFENLPGYGKPIEGLGESHDPDWWVKKLIEREQITVIPPSVALRREDAALDDELDRYPTEKEVREHVEDFNARVISARYSLNPWPPLVTMPRDVEATVAAWKERYAARRTVVRTEPAAPPRRRPWWNRRRKRSEGGS
jgi:hypothetical protein